MQQIRALFIALNNVYRQTLQSGHFTDAPHVISIKPTPDSEHQLGKSTSQLD